MSSSTWTARAVGSEAARSQRRLWRAVEAQHVASTLRLVESLEAQIILEGLLERSKPPLPAQSQELHYLLSTPFRYTSPIGSRFRAPGDSGVWYGAEAQRCACAELGYWRWRFLTDCAALAELGPAPQTVLRAAIDAQLIDLTRSPFKSSRQKWTHPRHYEATQEFARIARAAAIDAIRYESVRDPRRGAAVAVLSPACFKPRQPLEQQSWFLTVRRGAVVWQSEAATFEFDASAWR